MKLVKLLALTTSAFLIFGSSVCVYATEEEGTLIEVKTGAIHSGAKIYQDVESKEMIADLSNIEGVKDGDNIVVYEDGDTNTKVGIEIVESNPLLRASPGNGQTSWSVGKMPAGTYVLRPWIETDHVKASFYEDVSGYPIVIHNVYDAAYTVYFGSVSDSSLNLIQATPGSGESYAKSSLSIKGTLSQGGFNGYSLAGFLRHEMNASGQQRLVWNLAPTK